MPQRLANRYDVERSLGRQTGRRTLLAKDTQTDEWVVIKVLLLGDEFDWQDLKLFEREAKTLESLSHPAIPRYLDYLELDEPDGKGFALVQSYVEGRSLEDHLKAGRSFSEYEVKQLADALLEILIYLHSHTPPVIHRDIKPSNILLTNRSGNSPGQVYLVDFGSVQNLVAQEGGTITVVGTYGYMPPEQFGGRVTPASDLYSLGATLIFLITGRHPTELPQTNFQIQFEKYAQITSSFACWLQWLTQPALDQRLDSAETALRSLRFPQMRPAPATPDNPMPLSDLVVHKTPSSFTVFFPRRNLGYYLLGFLSVLIPVCVGQVLNVTSTVLSGLFGVILFIIIPLTAILLLKRDRLQIDEQRISLLSGFLGSSSGDYLRRRSAPVQAISAIHLYYVGEYQFERGVVFWVTQLTIHAGQQRFSLKHRHFTPEELEWLAEELSEWLGVPIVRHKS
ncbi:MAG: serine/threonine protein kinase [Oscillatoriales cyanobacterium C42_A2020_001]|nr:serine/threonine protein kinase [Leptolyngbyaceae cyanobacterium C42_A2020_001]